MNLDFLDELKQLEPFGAGNEEPIFRLKNVEIAEIRKMGAEENHLRLDVKDKHGNTLKLVAFFAPENWLNLDYEAKIEPIIKLVENDFNGGVFFKNAGKIKYQPDEKNYHGGAKMKNFKHAKHRS